MVELFPVVCAETGVSHNGIEVRLTFLNLKNVQQKIFSLVEATFIFENGQVAKLSSIPAEFRSLFEEIHKVAQQFRNLVEWDLASFTALLVLQYLGVSEGKIFFHKITYLCLKMKLLSKFSRFRVNIKSKNFEKSSSFQP